MFNTSAEATKAAELAIGRILRLGSREYQEGDERDYENARAVFYDAMDYLGIGPQPDNRPNYAAQYSKIHHD